jgi:methyl-accepting chemotaxis protein
MFRRISTRLYISFVIYLALVAGLSVSCTLLLRGQRDDGVVVNLSGRQRMLTQRMTHQLLYFAVLDAEGLTTIRVFETTLRALDHGGPAPLDLQMTTLRALPAPSLEVRHQLGRVQRVWAPFYTHARAILDGQKTERAAAVQHVVTHNTELLSEMDATVVLIQREAETKVDQLSHVQIGAVAVALLITMLLVWFVQRSISQPLYLLGVASREMSLGNLHREVPVAGPHEIAQIGQSFERLRLSLRTILNAQSHGRPMDALDRELMSLS